MNILFPNEHCWKVVHIRCKSRNELFNKGIITSFFSLFVKKSSEKNTTNSPPQKALHWFPKP